MNTNTIYPQVNRPDAPPVPDKLTWQARRLLTLVKFVCNRYQVTETRLGDIEAAGRAGIKQHELMRAQQNLVKAGLLTVRQGRCSAVYTPAKFTLQKPDKTEPIQ